MTKEEFLDFRKVWVADDVDWDRLAGLEDDEKVDGSDPAARTEYLRTWGGTEVTLRMCHFDFVHAGRYELKFRNQGFDPAGFGKTSTGEDIQTTSYFYGYVTSQDVYYYDAEFVSKSRMAYDVAIYAEAFRNSKAFDEIADAFDELFSAVRTEDHKAFESCAKRYGMEVRKDGSVSVDCYDRFGVIFDLTVIPAV